MIKFIKNLWGFGNRFKRNSVDAHDENAQNNSPMQGLMDSQNTFSESMKNWKTLFKRRSDATDEIAEELQEDPLAQLTTLDQRANDVRRKTLKRAALTVFLLSFGMFIFIGLYKTGVILYRDSKRQEVPTKVQNLKLEINSMSKWQELKDQQIQELGENIKDINQTVDKKITDFHAAISQELDANNKSINESLKVLQQSNKEALSETLNEIKSEIQNASTDSKQYTDQKNLTISEKIAQLESRKPKEAGLDFSKAQLPQAQQPQNQSQQNPSNVANGTGLPNAQILSQKEKTIQIVEEDMGEGGVLDYSTTITKENNETDKLPKMTLMAGFQRATLVTGADVPTLQKGNDLTRTVWFSTTGDMLIANGHTENIKECIIQAAATGNFASASADIRLTKISCSAVDENGKYYKLVGNVKGWVYGENGKQGLKGRLVTKEGELIEKAIPLALLEGAIKALENSTKSSSTVYAYPGTTGTSTMNNIQDSFTEGTTKTASTTLDKFSDYYLMILEQLNPTIELKAGRETTIGFEGGEVFQLEEYTPADVDFFEKRGLLQ
ncbi:MAG: hypothetical protein KU29_03245 [Sulfurovum sp. FS06-10]|nr:MAG: hypothetical protein KU29_03245 [Sulfurovum sp. FS06-10]